MFFGDGFPGGFPGGGGGGPPRNVDNNKFYDILGVPKDANDNDIKKAYRKLAMKHHPDKPGGDTEKFQEIGRAFECLSDPEKRSLYDKGGEEALEGGGHGGDAGDIFDMFFGGGGGGGGRRAKQVRKTESVKTNSNVTLDELFSGCTKKIQITRDVICKVCDGLGGPKDKFVTCAECKGNGVKVRIQRMGPMISQQQIPCGACQQEGKVIEPRFKCKPCHGKGLSSNKETLETFIEPGSANGKKIVFEQKADEKPGCIAGDIIMMVVQKPHATFTRKGAYLFCKKDISILDIFTGFEFDLPHLAGRKVLVKVPPGSLTNLSEPTMRVPKEGMPRRGNVNNRGDLIIEFKIELPTNALAQPQIDALRQVLPASKLPSPKFSVDNSTVDVGYASMVDLQHLNLVDAESEEEDDHQGHGGQGVQCQQG